MNSAEAAAGENELPTDLRIAATHKAQEFDLLFSVRGEVGMAAFGRHNAVTAAVPDEERLAQAGPGGYQSASATRLGSACVENTEILGWKMLNAVAGGAEIV